MNTFDLVCAELSAAAYRDGIGSANRVLPVADATQLPAQLGYRAGTGGFEASAFEYEDKIIIAFAGTNPHQTQDLFANLALALGGTHPQLLQAAEFYESIKNDPQYAGKEIVFTGHSLGGGLAAAMGVLFDRSAVTFDPAPFRLLASKQHADSILRNLAKTHPEWPVDAALQSFTTVEGIVGAHAPLLSSIVASIVAVFSARSAAAVSLLPFPITIRGENNIKTYSVSGEFLTANFLGMGAKPTRCPGSWPRWGSSIGRSRRLRLAMGCLAPRPA